VRVGATSAAIAADSGPRSPWLQPRGIVRVGATSAAIAADSSTRSPWLEPRGGLRAVGATSAAIAADSGLGSPRGGNPWRPETRLQAERTPKTSSKARRRELRLMPVMGEASARQRCRAAPSPTGCRRVMPLRDIVGLRKGRSDSGVSSGDPLSLYFGFEPMACFGLRDLLLGPGAGPRFRYARARRHRPTASRRS
jgi:hypothetical protein